ncbi:phenylalanyl-tRNA synthetase alpha chain [Fistulifera solaris]|uniref:Phenylalanine--tRNA ligase alpha subunit n=1 Tax=Fistulifera solaris TaxID=1519565 RepID=A0A1Z5K7B5_FISSO|nr:phenylalanyl-tRNA synthetase alpha chain [Fistulifera solaris]|eukprot:GAX22116.1 phenylalanyl-tRNA synthetase alpha chain [Fistulifera solaris]
MKLSCWIHFAVLASISVEAFLPTSLRISHGVHTATTVSRHPNFLPQRDPVRALSMTGTSEQVVPIEQVSAELQQVKEEFDAKMDQVKTVADAEAIRREYLGKKGPINKAMGYMRLLSNEDKPKLGAVVNEIKEALETRVTESMKQLEIGMIEEKMKAEYIDVTMPGISRYPDIGRRHPLSMTMEKAIDIFTSLGYDTVTSVEDSPEIETDYNCFEALNCPKDHPARDMQDTFYLTEDMEYLLRTHTSSVQIRQLKKRKPPLRIVAPGRVYRKDDIDATHSLMFHQVEILALEKRGELNLGHLKGTVEHFLKEMLGPDIQVRFRGSYFPFTEPSMEVDVFFRGKWMEVLGCGMVDPNVLEMAGIDPNEYSGFAAGFGVERFCMVIHGVKDLREFTKNDKRFLEQFPHFYDDGLSNFLSGKPQPEPKPDPRGEKVPSRIVRSLAELEALNKQETEKLTTASEKQEQAPSAEIDVSKFDIRVGIITKAWEHEEAEKLFCEEIDIGEPEGPRKIASGLRAHYSVDDLVGQRVLVLSNLKERKLVGFPSHGMVLCASAGDQVKFVEPPEGAKIGERVMVEGFDGEPATENQIIKKKMLDVVFPDLKTDSSGVATYKGVPLSTSAGACKAPLPDADVA